MRSLLVRMTALAAASVIATSLFAGDTFAQQRQRQQAPAPAPAAPAAPTELPPVGTKIVAVDVNRLLHESEAGKQVRSQVDRQLSVFQAEVSKQENDLRAADQELSKQRSVLAPEAFQQRVEELRKKVAAANQSVKDRRQAFDKAFGEGMGKVQQAMLEIIAQIATERQYEIVLHSGQVVMVANALDITAEVLRRLNQKLPQVTVNFPR